MRCPQCGNINLEPARSCQVCGAPLQDATDQPPPSAGGSAEQPLATVLYEAAVGAVNTRYYVRRFTAFDTAGKTGVSWNPMASLATLSWLGYRRMWLEALVYAALSLMLSLGVLGIVPLMWNLTEEARWLMVGLLLLVLFVVPGMWANALYYHACNRSITHALQSSPDIRHTCDDLALRASTLRRIWTMVPLSLTTWLSACALIFWAVNAEPTLMDTATVTPPVATPAHVDEAPVSQNASSAALAASAPASTSTAPQIAAAASELLTPAAAASAPASAPVAVSALTPSSTASVAAAASTPTVPKAVASEAAAPALKTTASALSPGRARFAVQVGLFALEPNALKAQATLHRAGLTAYTETIETREGTRQRLRVGPFATEREANVAARQIEALELPAVVVKR